MSPTSMDESRSWPIQENARTWAGKGSGAPCDLCEHPIAAREIEYEVELATPNGVRTLRFHLTCHQKWAKTRPP